MGYLNIKSHREWLPSELETTKLHVYHPEDKHKATKRLLFIAEVKFTNVCDDIKFRNIDVMFELND